MAFSPKLFSSLFLLSLFPSLLPNIHARESQFFNKVPTTDLNNYNAKDQQTSFEQEGYGLSGGESGMPFRPGTTTTAATSANYPYNSEQTVYHSTATPTAATSVNYPYNSEQTVHHSTATPTAATTNNYYKKNSVAVGEGQYNPTTATANRNNYYKNAAEKYESNRFGVQNGYNGQQQQQQQPQQRHGMSDTRYMNNGVFFYDVNKEKNTGGYNARGVVSTNQYNTNGNNAASNYGTKGYNGVQAEEEEEEEFEP